MAIAEIRPVIATRTLVLFSIQTDGLLHAGPLFDVVGIVGHSDKAMRDCLSRMVKEGALEHLDGRGRGATYRSTATGRALLDADIGWTAFAHRVDAGLEPWDHNWHLVGFEIPEHRRAARDAIRSLLVELGAAPLQSGLYVHAYDLSDFTAHHARHLGLVDDISTFSTQDLKVGRSADLEYVVGHLFHLESLADRYVAVEAQLQNIVRDAADQSDGALAAAMFTAAIATEAALRTDPLLPRELLPDDWIGARTRRVFLEAHRAAADHSPIYAGSSMFQTMVVEIVDALALTRMAFWARWFPRLTDSYQARLPPAARTKVRQTR